MTKPTTTVSRKPRFTLSSWAATNGYSNAMLKMLKPEDRDAILPALYASADAVTLRDRAQRLARDAEQAVAASNVLQAQADQIGAVIAKLDRIKAAAT